MKPITWQPSTIQTDGERQWAEWVLCFIGGPRETVYSDCSSLDRRAKMSTSRKPRVKLAKHRRSARKELEPEPAESSTAESRPPQRGEQSPPALRSQVLNLFAFATGYRAKNYLQDSVCSLAHFRAYAGPVRHTETDDAWNPWATGTLLSDTSSTVDTLTSEGKDEKDFILPDYPSDELTSSESSDSEPEEAPAENLSTGWSERVTRVDTQFHGDHVGPQNIPDHINHESTALSFLELFLDADFWGLLCRQTNLRAEQVKQSKPASYYAKNFRPVAVPELKAFLGLGLQMRHQSPV